MMKKLIALMICIAVCSITCYSQQRKTIDRTKTETGKLKKDTHTSTVVTRQKAKTSPKRAQNHPPRQVAKSNYFSISSQSVSFGADGGTTFFEVSSSGSWRISINTASWGHLTRSGNTLRLRVDPIHSVSSRSDYFMISSGSKSIRVNISQKREESAKSSSINATIKSVKVYNNADIGGEKGLSVNVSFDVSGMKGHSGKVSCYFYDANGNALINTNGHYGTNETPSHVAVSRSINPGYENTPYTDYEIKIPYQELHLSGSYSRTLKVDVIIWDYSSGNGVKVTRYDGTTFTCTPTGSSNSSNSITKATITSIEQVHNVMNGNVKGMNIKLKFDVDGMKGRMIKAAAWFYFADNTTPLKNISGGQVNVSKSDVSPYDGTTFNMTLFMPYQGLNMASGWRGLLSFDICISDEKTGNTLTRRNNQTFNFSN